MNHYKLIKASPRPGVPPSVVSIEAEDDDAAMRMAEEFTSLMSWNYLLVDAHCMPIARLPANLYSWERF